ncbi:4-Cys prefix domain-containing protein [Acaryochloris sp. 'Moss Beach']|uniref:4-Cys prefix domain-containing protein n=1 Tax=Acaryochloris sp. 'Moss Beach' TaxID=2740837 RepID=UPI0037C12F06
MSYCINPNCDQRENPPGIDLCQGCGTSLLIKDKYRLLRPHTLFGYEQTALPPLRLKFLSALILLETLKIPQTLQKFSKFSIQKTLSLSNLQRGKPML